MKNLISNLLFVIWFISAISCDKESLDNGNKPVTLNTYQLEITKNNLPHNTYIFNDEGVIEEMTYEEGILIYKIDYLKDSLNGLLIKNYYENGSALNYIDSIFFINNRINHMITYFKASMGWTNSNVYDLFNYNSNNQLIEHIVYDSLNSDYLKLTYEYNSENKIIYMYYPIETGYPQDSLFFDSYKSIYSILNLPRIDEKAISENNIIKVKRRSLVDNDFDFDTIDYVYYTSSFNYDLNKLPIQEIRKYANNITDTFAFKITEIK